jgi:hypothetical protein
VIASSSSGGVAISAERSAVHSWGSTCGSTVIEPIPCRLSAFRTNENEA